MGWKDAPAVDGGNAWQSAPVVEATPQTSQELYISAPHRAFAPVSNIINSLPGEDAMYDFGDNVAIKELWKSSLAPLKNKLTNFLAAAFPNTVETKSQKRSRAANAVAMSHIFNIPVSDAYEQHDQIAEQVGLRQGPQNAPELALDFASGPQGMAMGGAAAIGATGVLHLARGMAEFMALLEGIRFGVSKLKDKPFEETKGISDLLPEDSSRFTKDLVDVIEFIGLGGVAAGIDKKGANMLNLLTKKTIVEHDLPRTLYIPSSKVREILTTSSFTEGKPKPTEGGLLQEKAPTPTGQGFTKEEYDFVTEVLGGDSVLYRQAVKNGLEIEVPADKLVNIVDRDYWARIKEVFRLKPTAETTRILADRPRMKFEGLPAPKETEVRVETEPVTSKVKVPEVEAPEVTVPVEKGRAAGVSDRLVPQTLRNWLTGIRTGEWPDIPAPTGMTRWLQALRKGDVSKIRLNELLNETKDLPFMVHEGNDASAVKTAKDLVSEAYKEGEKGGKQSAQEKHDAEVDRLVEEYDRKLGKLQKKLDTRIVREDLKKTQAKLKAYVQKLIKRMQKPVGGSVDFAYRQFIESMQDMYTVKGWKKAADTKAIRWYLNENPEAQELLTPALLKRLEEAPASELTIADLEAVHDTIVALNKKGREVYREKLLERSRRHATTRDEIVSALGGYAHDPGRATKALSKGKTVWVAGKKGIIGSFDANTLRPDRIFDMMDGGEATFRGPAHKFFFDRTNELVAQRMRLVDARKQAFVETQKRFKVTTRDLAKEYTVDGQTFTLDEMLDIYAKWKNPRGKLAVIGNLAEHYRSEGQPPGERLNANGQDIFAMAEALGDNVIRSLDKHETAKAFADWIIDEYSANFGRLRETFIDYANVDMPIEEAYTPIQRVNRDTGENDMEMANDLLHRANLRKAYPNKDMTKGRVDIPVEYQQQIKLGLVETWLQHVEKQEHFINLAHHVRDLQRMVSDPLVTDTVTAKLGRAYTDQIKDYVNRVGNPSIYRAYDASNAFSRALRRNAYTAYLAYNLRSVLNQVAGLPLYLADAGIKHLSSAMGQFVAHPRETINFVIEHDPFIKNRAILREFEELKSLSETIAGQQKSKLFNEWGMKLTTVVDRLVTVIGWKGVYDRAIAEGLSKEEAIRLARNSTQRTQSTAHAHMLPGFMAKNETLNWLSFMQNQGSQLWNITRYDLPHKLKGGDTMGALMTGVGLALSAAMISVISEHSVGWDAGLTKQTVGAVPVAGSYLVAAANEFKTAPVPITMMWNVGSAAADVVGNDIDDQTFNKLWQTACIANGIPYTGVKRVFKTLETGDPIELIGYPMKSK
jgi:hypothetical protein